MQSVKIDIPSGATGYRWSSLSKCGYVFYKYDPELGWYYWNKDILDDSYCWHRFSLSRKPEGLLPIESLYPDLTGSYQCDRCGDVYNHEDTYNIWVGKDGSINFLIHGWYGIYDGQEMCDNCWDSY